MLDANVLFSAAYQPDTDLRQLWQLADTTLLIWAVTVAVTPLVWPF